MKVAKLANKKTVSPKKSFQIGQEEEEQFDQELFLAYQMKQVCNTVLTIPIDTAFKEPSYYRYVCKAISDLNEGDTAEFLINSPGGNYYGMLSLLSAVRSTPATTVAIVQGSAVSAANILMMHCDEVYISEYAEGMTHFVSYATGGKGWDVKTHVDHVQKSSERLFRDSYYGFLTEDEIVACLKGSEIWMDADEMIERLNNRVAIMRSDLEEDEEEECEGNCENCSCGED